MDYGLLGGLAEGFKQGLIAYKGEKNRLEDIEKEKLNREYKKEQDQKDYELRKAQLDAQERAREQQKKLELASKGLIETATGEFTPDVNSPIFRGQKTKEKGEELGLLKTQAEIDKIKAETKAKGLLSPSENREASFKSLPRDKQILIEKTSTKKADYDTIKDQFDSVVAQLKDPSISDKQKLQIANESAKLINSTLGSDAVGAEEVKRLLNYLEYNPQPFGPKGMKFGPDLKSFTEALENNAKRVGSASQQMQSRIDKTFGRKGLIEEQAPTTKVINGKTYRKVPGGWEEVD